MVAHFGHSDARVIAGILELCCLSLEVDKPKVLGQERSICTTKDSNFGLTDYARSEGSYLRSVRDLYYFPNCLYRVILFDLISYLGVVPLSTARDSSEYIYHVFYSCSREVGSGLAHCWAALPVL
jgi:hypothetical protein